MERTRFIQHGGRRVVLLDYTDVSDPETGLAEIERSREFFASQKPDGSLLTLTDVTGSRYNGQIVDALKRLTQHNRPYVRAAAVVTTSGLHQIAIVTVAMFSKRNLKVFRTREEALEWLVGKAA